VFARPDDEVPLEVPDEVVNVDVDAPNDLGNAVPTTPPGHGAQDVVEPVLDGSMSRDEKIAAIVAFLQSVLAHTGYEPAEPDVHVIGEQIFIRMPAIGLPPAPEWEQSPTATLKGVHGTFLPGLLGITRDGVIRPNAAEWNVIFWRSRVHLSAADTAALIAKAREDLWRPYHIEVQSFTAGYGKLRYGGHEEERASAAEHGCCRKLTANGSEIRTTAVDGVLQVVAVWASCASFVNA
jgi:hypothetical protein